MKTLDMLTPAAGPPVLIDSGLLRASASIPVEQALSALGDPETVAELAQRLTTTVSM